MANTASTAVVAAAIELVATSTTTGIIDTAAVIIHRSQYSTAARFDSTLVTLE